MVEIKKLSKKYPKTQVFSAFNLNVKKSKITCILGESGSGKTTLLNILAGLTDYEGEVNAPPCSYVFQKPNLFPNLTAKQNLTLVCRDEDMVNGMAEELGIKDKLNSYPKHMSGGQAQRVALARGLLFDRELLLLDEPFANLDLGLKFHLTDKVKKLHEQKGNTIIAVTHDVQEALALADRIILLDSGRIVFDTESITNNTKDELIAILTAKYSCDNAIQKLNAKN